MSDIDILPDIERVVGSLLFVTRSPLTIDAVKRVFNRVAEEHGGLAADYAGIKSDRVRQAIEAVARKMEKDNLGFKVVEVAGGYRLENDPECGPWVRELLEKNKPRALSIPALETLAIVAYRQPCTRAQIEEIRGVAVDQILRNLLALQLVKISGRSEVPGRPWLFATTTNFLEHFGLNSLSELPSHKDLKKFDDERKELKKQEPGEEPVFYEDIPEQDAGPNEEEETDES